MRRWSLPLLIAGLIFLASVAPASAPRRPAANESNAVGPHPEAVGEVDRTGYIKGIYVSYAAMSDAGFVRHIQDLLENTELNAVVFDFKSDHGLLSFPSQVPVAIAIGAAESPVVKDAATFLNWFKQRNVYTIARIVTFKDDPLAHARPDLAIIDAATGQIWHDHEGMGWVDPFRQATWDYNSALALEAAQLGFDEVQFDYVRFPTDGSISNALYSLPNNEENRTAAITGLLKLIRQAIAPTNIKLSVDIFGYTAWVPDDLGIGQHIEALAPFVDVLAPMLYPSTFNAGLPGESPQYRDAIAYPYDIVHLSTQRARARAQAANPAIQVRPWLQDFQDYAFDGRQYTPSQIRRQMDGARAAGARGWMLWDPAVQYTREALVSAHPNYIPNPDGKVMVIAYRDFSSSVDSEGPSPQSLRADLEALLAAGFYPINLRDLAEGKLRGVPAGKRPVALTFDDATIDQFRLLPGGAVDPESAVGVLLAMNADHPADWPLRATFFVRTSGAPSADTVFGTPDLASAKLQLLISWGMEVGVKPAEGQSLNRSSAEEAQQVLEQAVTPIAAWLPDYDVTTLALSESQLPDDSSLWQSISAPTNAHTITGVVLSAGGLAPAPGAPGFFPYRIPRMPSQELSLWLVRAQEFGVHYVSSGE